MDTPCRFFSAPNGCYRGDACTYRHDRPSGQKGAEADDVNGDGGIAISSTNPYSFSQSGGGLAPPPPRPCRFYSTGSCRNGNMCQFSHMGPPATPVGYSGVDDENEYAPNEYAAYYDYNGLMPGDAPPVMMMDAMHIGDAPTMQQQPPRGSDNGGATTPRRTLKIQANPQKKNYEVISEILPVLSRNIEGPVRLPSHRTIRQTECSRSLLCSSSLQLTWNAWPLAMATSECCLHTLAGDW